MVDGFGYPRRRLWEWRALRVLDMTRVGLAFDHIHTGALLNLALRLTTGTSLSFHPKPLIGGSAANGRNARSALYELGHYPEAARPYCNLKYLSSFLSLM